MSFKFECPKCGAPSHEHGKGGLDGCMNEDLHCEGLICDCNLIDAPLSELDDHGSSLNNPCTEANCYHCGWGGTVPVKPKGLQAWEKKALEAGWKMPEAREKELSTRDPG